MADLRIVDAPVLLQESITDDVKMPTGGLGNFSIRLGDIVWYVVTKEQLANKNYVDTSSKGVKDSLDEHIADKANPHQVTKAQVGLGNVDNTADIDKPVSNAVSSAIITATTDMATKAYVNSKDGDLTTLKTADKTNLVKAVNEIHDVTNVEAGAGANGWTDTLIAVSENINQRQINDGLESVAQLAGIKNPRNGMRVFVKSYHAGLGKGGGTFVYDDSKTNINNGVTVFNGWVRNDVKFFTPEMAGAKADGVSDDTAAFDKLLAVTKSFSLLEATYLVNLVINKVFDIAGVGMTKSILKAFDKTKPLIRYTEYGGSWDYAYLANCRLVGAGEREGDGFVFGDDTYKEGVALAGRVKFKDIYSYNFNRHMVKLWGNIGNTYDNVQFFKGNYGYWARSSRAQSPNNQLMHAGCDLFLGGQFCEFEKAGVLVFDTDDGGGQWTFINTIFEYNNGQPIYFDLEYAYTNLWSPITLIGCWFEENAKYATVTVDTLSGPKTITPVDYFMQNGGVYPSYFNVGQVLQFGTTKHVGSMNVWGNNRAALSLYSGKFGTQDNTRVSFISENDPANGEGAYINSNKYGSSFGRTVEVFSDGKQCAYFGENNKVVIGYSGSLGHFIGANNAVTLAGHEATPVGDEIARIKAGFGGAVRFFQMDANGGSDVAAAMRIGFNTSTGRSINAGGTVNTSGADYAEYMTKSETCGEILKGDICGVDASGLLTDKFDQSVSFVVKTTNPSFVGGDSWFTEEAPEETEDNTETYAQLLTDYKARLELARQKVDRIAFCGQVPINISNAKVGSYIIADNVNNKIVAKAVSNPTFKEYKNAVGRVIAINGGKVTIIVKTC